MTPIRIILWLTTIALVGLEIYAVVTGSRYKWDFIFLMLMLWSVYFLRDRINLHPLHFGLLAIFLLLHFFGMFGLYETYPLGLEYDHWVHGYFGFVSALIVFRAYHYYQLYSPAFIVVATLVVILGFSAFHEIFEFLGAITVGEGEGVLFIGAGDIDEWDTQKDMVNNVVGALIGLAAYFGYAHLRPDRTSIQRSTAASTAP